jgi:ribosomal protein L16 Arg81 hydroxylase
MSCRFLENLTLASLIAPVGEAEFRERYWEKQPLVVERGDSDYYDDLFTLRDFDDAITRSPDYIKMANAATKKNTSYKPSSAMGIEAVLNDMRSGGTLVLDQLHNREPKLNLLCRALAPEFGHRFQTNLYLTPPHGKGFSPHWDNHDVFILQTAGSKHWKIERERRLLPEKGQSMGDEGRELHGQVQSFTLKQGDLIYIPRGFVHAAECGSEPSLHITLGVTAVFLEDLLSAIIKAGLQRDERLRMALPLGFMRGVNKDVVRCAKGALLGLCDEGFLTNVVDEFRDELVKSYPLDVSGQIYDFFQPEPLSLMDSVGPRRGMVYQIHSADDAVRLNVGGRSIVFPGFFGESLNFALKTPSYAIGEITGELEDEEKLVFIERLMQEGLVIRKNRHQQS